jgi:hypothetical protein
MTLGMALTVFAQPELSNLIEGCRLSKLENREVVETYSRFWLSALMPPEKECSLETLASAQGVSA